MSYFNPAQETEVIVDARPVGLGGLLVRDGKVISYASRALGDVESRYSQTEREMLAIGLNVADEYVNCVCTNAVPKTMTLQEIQAETEKDSTLQSPIKAIETDRWTISEILD